MQPHTQIYLYLLTHIYKHLHIPTLVSPYSFTDTYTNSDIHTCWCICAHSLIHLINTLIHLHIHSNIHTPHTHSHSYLYTHSHTHSVLSYIHIFHTVIHAHKCSYIYSHRLILQLTYLHILTNLCSLIYLLKLTSHIHMFTYTNIHVHTLKHLYSHIFTISQGEGSSCLTNQ